MENYFKEKHVLNIGHAKFDLFDILSAGLMYAPIFEWISSFQIYLPSKMFLQGWRVNENARDFLDVYKILLW